MSLPLVQSYNDPKIDKAYRLYMEGCSQRKTLSKVRGLSARTLARYCKNDGWEDERRARALTEETPNVAAVAAEAASPAAKSAETAANGVVPADGDTRLSGMTGMLERQQRLAGLLADALRKDIEGTIAAAENVGKPLSRSQIAQLTTLSNNLFTLERKAWCVPDKMEFEDKTPAARKHADKIRDLIAGHPAEAREEEVAN